MFSKIFQVSVIAAAMEITIAVKMEQQTQVAAGGKVLEAAQNGDTDVANQEATKPDTKKECAYLDGGILCDLVRRNELDAIQRLYRINPDIINIKCGEFQEPIAFEAASYGHRKLLEWILHQENYVGGITLKNGSTVAHRAARRGKLEVFKWVCDQNPGLINSRDHERGRTPAHVAANQRDLKVFKWIFDRKDAANIIHVKDEPSHYGNNCGRTPAQLAAATFAFVCYEPESVKNIEDYKWICDQKDGAQLIDKQVVREAARNGNIPVFKWICNRKDAAQLINIKC